MSQNLAIYGGTPVILPGSIRAWPPVETNLGRPRFIRKLRPGAIIPAIVIGIWSFARGRVRQHGHRTRH